jgi:hypothetical protein
MKYCSDNREVLNPRFVANSLKGIRHRFVFVLEVEYRNPQMVTEEGVIPPRYSIAGPMASLDPLRASVRDLIPLTKHKLELIKGWEKIHQFMYVLTPATDEHGWQYRSDFEDPHPDQQEPWAKEMDPELNVRRRIWMTTIGPADQLIFSKKKLAEGLQKRAKHLIMEGELLRHELTPGTLTKTWQKRYIYLYTNTVEIYTVSKADGGRKLAEIQLQECECHILFGSQSNDRPFAFAISHHSRSTALAVLDAGTPIVVVLYIHVFVSYASSFLSRKSRYTKALVCGDSLSVGVGDSRFVYVQLSLKSCWKIKISSYKQT